MGNDDLNLLPNYYKKIAGGLFVAVILFAILHLTNVIPIDRDIGKLLLENGILLCLLIPAITRDKIEDELTVNIRMQAFVAGFIFGVLIVIINPLLIIILEGTYKSEYGSFQLLVSMLFFFHAFYIYGKRKR